MIFIKISNIAQKRVKIKKSTISSFTIRKTRKTILAQYRIGSLEKFADLTLGNARAQYRIGSLETKKINTVMRIA